MAGTLLAQAWKGAFLRGALPPPLGNGTETTVRAGGTLSTTGSVTASSLCTRWHWNTFYVIKGKIIMSFY